MKTRIPPGGRMTFLMTNVLLRIQYDGTDFHGWQRQPGQRTVQGTLEGALQQLFRTSVPVPVAAAGRTDAGVHAVEQAAGFKAKLPVPVERLAHALNGLLPQDLSVLSARAAPASFHATRSATSRAYRYVIRHGEVPRPLRRRFSWQIKHRLDFESMRRAAGGLVGTHDFAGFQDVGSNLRGTVRTVLRS